MGTNECGGNACEMPVDVISQSHVLLDAHGWLIGVPRTPGAARWWGRETAWCTAIDFGTFWEYFDKGPMIIFVRKTDGRRWQFQPATGEFRDESNKQVSWRGFVCRNPAALAAISGAFAQVRRSQIVDALL